MCRADYVNQCNAADWRKRRRPAPRRDTVETADCKNEPRTPTRDDQLRAVLNGAATVPRSIEKSTVHRRLSREDEIVRHQSVLTARLERLGLRERKCKDDGHCQFRALAAELFGDSSRHAYVRRRAVEELRRRADEFRVFVDGSWEYFLAALAKDAWGDELTLQAVADGVKIKEGAPRHRRDGVPGTASARWRGGSVT